MVVPILILRVYITLFLIDQLLSVEVIGVGYGYKYLFYVVSLILLTLFELKKKVGQLQIALSIVSIIVFAGFLIEVNNEVRFDLLIPFCFYGMSSVMHYFFSKKRGDK